jgi:hypothetical protein
MCYLFLNFPPTPTCIPRISSTLDLGLTNGLPEVCDLSTRTALSFDHLSVLVGAFCLWLQEFRLNLISLGNGFSTGLKFFTRPSWVWDWRWLYDSDLCWGDFGSESCCSSSRLFKSFLFCTNPANKVYYSPKKWLAACEYTRRDTLDRLEFETLSNLARDLCRGFGNKVRKLKPGHRSFWNFTKIIKNKFRAIPVLKMDGLTLLTESEKANAMASTFSLAHENSLHS